MIQRYNEFPHGVINAIEATDIPFNTIIKSRNVWYRENRWRKIPGLTEVSTSKMISDSIWSIIRWRKVFPKEDFILASGGSKLFKHNKATKNFNLLYSGLQPNQQIEFLPYGNFLYFGSIKDYWRRFDGGKKTYTIGAGRGTADTAPRKFKQIIYNRYSGRFFGIGEEDNPDYFRFSSHINFGGIEKWPTGNIQIIQSESGDTPQWMDIYEGRCNIFSQHSIHSGDVQGSPELWKFIREKSSTGTIAGRTVRRHGGSFFMLTPSHELYRWPQDVFVSKGRIKFEIDPAHDHLACAEYIENRYYVLVFKSMHQTSTDRYDMWIYDILGDRFYGPHKQYNLTSLYYDKTSRTLYCGGTDNFKGYVFEFRGKNIKNEISKVRIQSSMSDYGLPEIDKRYDMIFIKAKQEGLPRWARTNVHGDVQIDSAQSKFAQSILFNGGYLTLAYHTDFDLGTAGNGNYTIRFFVRFASLPTAGNAMYFVSTYPGSGSNGYQFGLVNVSGTYKLSFWTGGSINYLTWTTPTINTWYYLELTRSGSTVTAYIDATALGTFTDGDMSSDGEDLAIGSNNNVSASEVLDGWIDDFEIIKGTVNSHAVPTYEGNPLSYTVLFLKGNGIDGDNYFPDSSLSDGNRDDSGSLELIINTDSKYNNPQSQRIRLEDPENENLTDTNAIKESVVKRKHIHDQYGRGNSIGWELKHEVLNGDFEFSELSIQYHLLSQKEDRGK